MAALWRGFRTKHYGQHAKALRSRRLRAGLPEEPPPFGSNRMIKRDSSVLIRWEQKKMALERRLKLPSHESLLQQHARKRAWAQQRSDDRPAAFVHWSTRALLKTVASYDEMRPKASLSPQPLQRKRKSDKAVGNFALQWLSGVGAWGWVQSRIVLLLQATYRLFLVHIRGCLPRATMHTAAAHSHLRHQIASRTASSCARHAAETGCCAHASAVVSRFASERQQSQRRRKSQDSERLRGPQERVVRPNAQPR
jgi:hypothetical protein